MTPPTGQPTTPDHGAPIRLVIADDQALVRTGFRLILSEEPDLEVVGEAADGAAAAELARDLHPDVVLMDIRMPGVNGLDATRRIRAAAGDDPLPRVLILTTFDLDEYIYEGLCAGAAGFLLKDTLAPDLIAAVRVLHAGEAVTAPTVTRRLIRHFTNPAPTAPRPYDDRALRVLTTREREVLTLITRGMSNGEIAQALHLSEGTVKTHVGRILAKLALRDRIHAVILGYQTGLVRIGEP